MIHVVSGLIVRGGLALLTQRRITQDYPGTWETPGGKVEPGESHQDALVRELAEELGIDPLTCKVTCRVLSYFGVVVERDGSGPVCISFYEVIIPPDAEPRGAEGQGIGWFRAREIAQLTLAPANARLRWELCSLMEAMRHRPSTIHVRPSTNKLKQ